MLDKPVFLYLLVFVYGFVLVSEARFHRALERIKEASLVATIILYDVVVRRTNISRWLFGMKLAKRPTPRPLADASLH